MKRVILILVLILAFTVNSKSQMIHKWTILDTAAHNYTGSLRNDNIYCFDKDNILVIDQEFANASPFLRITKDGGYSWEETLKTEVFKFDFNAAAFASANTIYVCGDSTEYIYSDEYFNSFFKRTGVIFKSRDRGKTWQKIFLDSNQSLTELIMLNDSIGLANKRSAGNYFNQSVENIDTLLYTKDGFVKFTKISLPDTCNSVNYIKIFSPENFIIQAYKPSTKLYNFYETTDAGISWDKVFDLEGIEAVSFVDRQNIFAIRSRLKEGSSQKYIFSIYKSKNGGSSWDSCFTAYDKIWTDLWVTKISAADKDNIIAVGSNCIIYRSTDGAKTWTREFAPNSTDSIQAGYELEYDYIPFLAYPEKNSAYAVIGRMIVKMDGQKVLTRPSLNNYTSRINPKGIIAKWSKVEGALSYQFQLAYSGDDYYSIHKFDTLLVDENITDTTFIIPDMQFNSCYYGRVKAIGELLESEWTIKAAMFCTLKDENTLPGPLFISPTAGEEIKGHSFKFIWTKVVGINKYELKICDNPIFMGNNLRERNIDNDTSVTIEDLPQDMNLYAKLRGNDGTKSTEWTYLGFSTAEPINVIDISTGLNSLKVFPNPVEDNIFITRKGELDNSEIQIFNLIGDKIYNGKFPAGVEEMKINTKNMSAGMYRLLVVHGNGMFHTANIIKK